MGKNSGEVYSRRDLAENLEIPQTKMKDMFDGLVEFLEAMEVGDSLRIQGLGIFEKFKTVSRNARNPHTGETIKTTPKTKVRFRISNKFKDM